MAKSFITLQQTEGFIVQAAAQIYAARIAGGNLDESQESACMQKAIKDAIRIAKTVDSAVQAEGEYD